MRRKAVQKKMERNRSAAGKAALCLSREFCFDRKFTQPSRKKQARRPVDGGLCFAAFFSPPFYGGSYEGFAGALPLHPATF